MRNLFVLLMGEAERRVPLLDLRSRSRRLGAATGVLFAAVVVLMIAAGVSYSVSVASDDAAYATYVLFTWCWSLGALAGIALLITYLMTRSSLNDAGNQVQALLEAAVRVAFDRVMERKVSQYAAATPTTTEHLGGWLLRWLTSRGAQQATLTHPSAEGLGLESTECVMWVSSSVNGPTTRDVDGLAQIAVARGKAPILVATTYFQPDALDLADRRGVTLLVLDRHLMEMTAGNILGQRLLERGGIFQGG